MWSAGRSGADLNANAVTKDHKELALSTSLVSIRNNSPRKRQIQLPAVRRHTVPALSALPFENRKAVEVQLIFPERSQRTSLPWNEDFKAREDPGTQSHFPGRFSSINSTEPERQCQTEVHLRVPGIAEQAARFGGAGDRRYESAGFLAHRCEAKNTVARSTRIAWPRLVIDNLQLFSENDIAGNSAAERTAGENIGWKVGLQGHA